MLAKLLVETLVIWVLFFLYVWLSTVPLGPVGGAFYYEQNIQDRLVELGLITRERIERRRRVAVTSGVVAVLAVLFTCVCVINGARNYLDIVWQTYVLFILMELFDCVVIDTLWVALSGWWDIPGIEDLSASYKDWRTRMRAKLPRICLGGIPLSFILGSLFWLVAKAL
ncbi:MAG: hypothetical protein IJ781_00810 [Atopobiaceae bacterium]|nr:hypothetical protein [Atopobiaceae bacterium]